MMLQQRLVTVLGVAVLGFASLGLVADARAADLPTYTIDPTATDPAIVDTTPRPAPGNHHLVWLAPEARRVGKLLVFLPSGGLPNVPSQFSELGAVAGRLGYHTILLAYRNEAPIAALPTASPPGCGTGAGKETAPENCAYDARLEILTGGGQSTVVNVDEANGIENRLEKLLEHLVATAPEQDGWADFLDADGKPKWSETVISGHSLGAGQAVLAGMRHRVFRVAAFGGWTDAQHEWSTIGATPSEDHYALIHARDNFFPRACFAYVDLELADACPLPGFPLPIDASNPLLFENREPSVRSQLHVFNLPPGSTMGTGDHPHQSTARNGWIAREADGTPSHILVRAWSAVLGDDTDDDAITNTSDNCPGTANGDQADADADGSGDGCDRSPQGTTPPTIAVPAHVTVNATGPAGATVSYLVTATDDLPPPPSPVCTPSTGSLFATGDTLVGCTATDGGGNMASASFVVSVLGAEEQLADLIGKVTDSASLPAAVETQLIVSLQSLERGSDPDKPSQRAAACRTLKAFGVVVQFLAPPAQAAEWTADANRIRAVLAC